MKPQSFPTSQLFLSFKMDIPALSQSPPSTFAVALTSSQRVLVAQMLSPVNPYPLGSPSLSTTKPEPFQLLEMWLQQVAWHQLGTLPQVCRIARLHVGWGSLCEIWAGCIMPEWPPTKVARWRLRSTGNMNGMNKCKEVGIGERKAKQQFRGASLLRSAGERNGKQSGHLMEALSK